MIARRRLLAGMALLMPASILAQQPGKVHVFGYLDYGSRDAMVNSGRFAALIDGLRELGYIEGRHFVLEARYAEGNAAKLNDFAAELVHRKVDILLSTGTPASHAAQRAAKTTPIVVTATTDPVGEGFAKTLARPGGNMTGTSTGNDDTVEKLLELMGTAVPRLKRVAVMRNTAVVNHSALLKRIQAAAGKTGRQVLPLPVSVARDIDGAFEAMTRERVDGVIVLADTFFLQQARQIAALALRYKLPSIYPRAQYPEVGGLMSYGAEISDNFCRAGYFIDRILKGAKPADIPFEQPTRYYLVVNRKTAISLRINLNGELLARADRVIE